jgi:hypothetical protein
MNNATKTFEVLKSFGVFAGMYSVSCLMNHEKGRWELTGNFRDANGYRSGKVAEFDSVEDAVDFEVLCQTL